MAEEIEKLILQGSKINDYVHSNFKKWAIFGAFFGLIIYIVLSRFILNSGMGFKLFQLRTKVGKRSSKSDTSQLEKESKEVEKKWKLLREKKKQLEELKGSHK